MSTIDRELSYVGSVSETRSRGSNTNKVNPQKSYKLISNEDTDENFEEVSGEKDKLENEGKFRKYIRNIKFTRKDLLLILCILISVSLYILSLAGCHDTQTACLVNLSPQFFHRITFYLVTASFLNSFIIFLFLKKKIQSYHFIILSIIFSYLTLIHDVGGDLAYHGSYNRTILIILMVLFQILIFLMSTLFSLIQKKFYKTIFFGFFLLFLIVFSLTYKLKNSCENWNRGLDKVVLDNDLSRNKCQITHPKTCWQNFLDGLLDVSWMLNEDCDKFRKGERTELMKYLNDELKESYKLGYPITTKYSWRNESMYSDFLPHVLNNYTDLTGKNESEHEVVLEFDKETKFGKINIEIKKNETLIEERRNKTKEEKEKPLTENILFIYVDSISRPHFLRKMKKTSEWIEKYIKDKNSSHLAYQFMKYHAFIFFTQLNIQPMFYGQSMYNKNGTLLIRHLKERGFITGQSNNICSREMYDLEEGYIDNLDWENFDHENIALFCDPNFFNPENPYTPYMGPYSVKKRCLYGRNTFEYVLEYGEKFWKTYINERKFLRVAFQDAHEGTGEVARYLDEELIIFLEKFEKNGWLNDTAIFFVSDHGNNMIGFYNIFSCEDFVMEKTLASLFLLLPKEKIDEATHQFIKNNQQVMVTPYDIYNTLLNFIGFDKDNKYFSKEGDSLLNKISGLHRDCGNYKQDLSDLWCRCY